MSHTFSQTSIRIVTVSSVSALVVYLLCSFASAGFDITVWTQVERAACAIFMAVVIGLGAFIGGHPE